METHLRFLEKIRLKYRAGRYRNKHDKGGILYLVSSVSRGQTLMDIGAHKAGYTWWMVKQLGSSGMVYAFEPQLHLYNYINRIKDMLRWDNVQVENLALSDEAQTSTLYIPVSRGRKSSPGATLTGGGEGGTDVLTETVGTETLDSYCNSKAVRPDFLKIDVEGNELKVLRGGIKTLKACKPRILIEIECRHAGREKVAETFGFLSSLGYTGHFIRGSERIPLHLFSIERDQNIQDMKNYCNNFTFETDRD
jgi:FkbM family methyltransferase